MNEVISLAIEKGGYDPIGRFEPQNRHYAILQDPLFWQAYWRGRMVLDGLPPKGRTIRKLARQSMHELVDAINDNNTEKFWKELLPLSNEVAL